MRPRSDGTWALTMTVAVQGAGAADLDAAKRAAEDALRQLCRDTLAALGDGK